MKVQVDPTKCQGYGQCNEVCPDVFALDEWGYAEVVETAAREEHEPAILAAVATCPEGAITVEPTEAAAEEED